jgi:hypothetical protein
MSPVPCMSPVWKWMPPQRRDQPASSAVSISLGQEMATFVAGVMPGSILGDARLDVTLALKSALFPKNMLSTRLPAALR